VTRTARSPWRPQHPRPLEAAYLRERDAAPDPTPICDACGARVAVVYRDIVEGIACDRCPTCHEDEVAP
jgi:hypothetical protein